MSLSSIGHKIYIAEYSLKYKSEFRTFFGTESESGIFFKLADHDGNFGYSAVKTLSLEKLGYYKLEIAKRQALADLEMRKNKISCCDKYKNYKIENNLTMIDLRSASPFNEAKNGVVKIKIRNLESKGLIRKFVENNRSLKFRFDFNARFSLQQITSFFENWSLIDLEQIDYLEDPVDFDQKNWKQLREKFKLAYDFPFFEDRKNLERLAELRGDIPLDVIILKPSEQILQPWFDFIESHALTEVVFTSAFDHPVSLIHAHREACDFYVKFSLKPQICGFKTDFIFEKNPWSDLIFSEGTDLPFTEGFGIGFDSLFDALSWKAYDAL